MDIPAGSVSSLLQCLSAIPYVFTVSVCPRKFLLQVDRRPEKQPPLRGWNSPCASRLDQCDQIPRHGEPKEVRDYADLARLGYVTRARLTQIMNLLLLAPDIQDALLISQMETVFRNAAFGRQSAK